MVYRVEGVEMRIADIGDSGLVSLAQTGDNAAFEELLARHDGRAFQVALAMLYDDYADASDAMQNARLKCWEALSGYRVTRGKFGAWYRAIVRNCCQTLYSQKRRHGGWMCLDELEEAVSTPLDQLIDLEERSFLRGAVAALPEQQSSAVRLRYLEDYNYREIAAQMDVTKSAVRDHVHRGIRNLRERLGNVGLGA